MTTATEADTRRLVTPRISSLSGYEAKPIVEPILTFDSMPRSSTYVGRLVEREKELWELWSPNSDRKAYCPGYSLTSFKLETPPQPLRRADGHLGRFDPTVNPQMYNLRPWYAFVLRHLPEGKKQHEYPEHNALRIAWVSDLPPATSTGRIHGEHLYELFGRNNTLETRMMELQPLARRKSAWWSQRPTDPTSELIKGLRGRVMEFEVAVDLYAQITRGIKLKAAWLEFVNRKNHDVPWSMRAMRMQPMERANDDFMGLWINAAQPELAYWLIRQRVPIFIIHKISEMEKHLCDDARRFSSFVADSEAERLSVNRNYLEHRAAKCNKLLPPLPSDEWILDMGYLRWDMLNPNHFNYSLSRNHNLPGMIGCTTCGAEEMLTNDASPSLETNALRDDQISLPVDPKHLPRPLELEEIDPDHVPWIRPPKIAHPTGGKWSKYTESTDDARNECMRKVNADEDLGKYVWYDRDRRRKLGFDSEPEVPPGVTTDVRVFGMPAPNVRYEYQTHQGFVAEGRSRWIYQSRTPTRQDLVAQIKRPSKSDLPRRTSNENKPKPIPVFRASDSDDEEEEFFSDHEDDLFPSFKERARIAAAKGEQEMLNPKDPSPPIVEKPVDIREEEIRPTLNQEMTTNIIPGIVLDAATARSSEEGMNPEVLESDVTERRQSLQSESTPDTIPTRQSKESDEDASDKAVPPITPPAAKSNQNESLASGSASSPAAAMARLEPELGLRITASTDDMDVDPNDDMLDYGISDDDMPEMTTNIIPGIVLDAATARSSEEGMNPEVLESDVTEGHQSKESDEDAPDKAVPPITPPAAKSNQNESLASGSASSPAAAMARLEPELGLGITASTDDMDVDPNDDLLDYGISDDDMPATAPMGSKGKQREDPVPNALEKGNESDIPKTLQDSPSLLFTSQQDEGGTSDHDVEMASGESTVEQVSDLVMRRAAGKLGIIDLVASSRPTEFLVVTGAPIQGVTWEDYLATVAKLIKDGTLFEGQFVQVIRTLLGLEQLFWMRSPSARAAIAGRGYLSARYTIDGVTLNCSFVSYTEYQDAWRRRTHIWPSDEVLELDTRPPDQPNASGSRSKRPRPPPSIAYRFGKPRLLSDMAVEEGISAEGPRTPLDQRIFTGAPLSLIERLRTPRLPSLVDRLGDANPTPRGSLADRIGGMNASPSETDRSDGAGNSGMGDESGVKLRPWKPRGKRAGKKHQKKTDTFDPPFPKRNGDDRGGSGSAGTTFGSLLLS
ncbi:hypothetical protein DXG01_005494 [Tephrocybe rancida]|nr:hypothetical protein DXG01_005494 [Tephrocybe rancida]